MTKSTWSARVVCDDQNEHETHGHEAPELALMQLIADAMGTLRANKTLLDSEFLEVSHRLLVRIENEAETLDNDAPESFVEQGGGMGIDFWTMEVYEVLQPMTEAECTMRLVDRMARVIRETIYDGDESYADITRDCARNIVEQLEL